MAFLTSSKVANSKASASRGESWRLKASKLREKAGGVGDRDIASKRITTSMSAREKKTVLSP